MISNMPIQKREESDLPEIFTLLNRKRYGDITVEPMCIYMLPSKLIYYYNKDYLCLTPASESDPEHAPDGSKKLSVGLNGMFCAICAQSSFKEDVHSVMNHLLDALREHYPNDFFSTDYKYCLFVNGHNLPIVYLKNQGLFAMDYLYDQTEDPLCGDTEAFVTFCLTELLGFLNEHNSQSEL